MWGRGKREVIHCCSLIHIFDTSLEEEEEGSERTCHFYSDCQPAVLIIITSLLHSCPSLTLGCWCVDQWVQWFADHIEWHHSFYLCQLGTSIRFLHSGPGKYFSSTLRATSRLILHLPGTTIWVAIKAWLLVGPSVTVGAIQVPWSAGIPNGMVALCPQWRCERAALNPCGGAEPVIGREGGRARGGRRGDNTIS